MKIKDAELPTLSSPFGYGDLFRDYSFYRTGITNDMTVPTASGGTRFNRHMMNGIGYLASLGTYLYQCGYPFSKVDIERAGYFGGYPQGAILYTINENGYVVEYMSKVDDNLQPIPDLVDGLPVENEFWQPLYEAKEFVPVPNYNELIDSVEMTFTQEDAEERNSFLLQCEVREPCFVKVTRTIKNWNSLDKLQLIWGVPQIVVYGKYYDARYNVYHTVALGDLPLFGGPDVTMSFPTAPASIYVESNSYNYEVYGPVTILIETYKIRV